MDRFETIAVVVTDKLSMHILVKVRSIPLIVGIDSRNSRTTSVALVNDAYKMLVPQQLVKNF